MASAAAEAPSLRSISRTAGRRARSELPAEGVSTMSANIIGLLLVGLLVFGVPWSLTVLRTRRRAFIETYSFPPGLTYALQKHYPSLSASEMILVQAALRQYFLMSLRAPKRSMPMPSKVVDALWHEFILDTKYYTGFCRKAFGRYFHHIPASSPAVSHKMPLTLKETFLLACQEEGISTQYPSRLPLLFAADAQTKIPDGNTYKLPEYLEAGKKASHWSGADFVGCGGGTACSGGDSDGGGGGCGGD